MDDIARAAGTSRTSVFNYFGYKEMILCEIGARYVAEIAGSVAAAARRSPRQRLLGLVDMVAELATREPELISPILREMTHPDPTRRRQAGDTMQYRDIVESSLDALEATGRLRAPHRRRSYARMMVDMVAGTVVRAGQVTVPARVSMLKASLGKQPARFDACWVLVMARTAACSRRLSRGPVP